MLEYITLDSVSSKFLKGKRLYKNLICEGYKVPLSLVLSSSSIG